MNCADCKQKLIEGNFVKVTFEVTSEFEGTKGAEFAYLCISCYNNGSSNNPDLWKNDQKEIEEL